MLDQYRDRELRQLIEAVAAYADPLDTEKVLTGAFELAAKGHAGVKRISGQPYLDHPLAVAALLAQWRAPAHVVAVGLLHDLLNPEYSRGYTTDTQLLETVRPLLGSDVAQLLDAVLKLNMYMRDVESVDFYSQAEASNFRHTMATYLSQDTEAIVVKIADRLHNMQTISALTRYFQERSADIGLNLLVPLIGFLGMGIVKRQMEDACFSITNPTFYSLLQQYYTDIAFQQDIASVSQELQQTFSALLPDCTVTWRPFSLYSIWQDLKPNKLVYTEPISLRVIDAGTFILMTRDEIDCYRALGLLHKRYPPLKGQLRDLIADRQENGYQSIHTQVKHSSGNLLRIAIRTRDMDVIAEYGFTARWRGVTTEFTPMLPGEKKSLEGKIQVLTPMGEVKYLPQGATPIDFAYSIHTDVGHHCADVLINGERGDLFSPLQMGDRVEIIAGGPESGPTLDWLRHVKTTLAVNRIRHWLAIHHRSEMAERGRALLDRELQTLSLDTSDPQVHELLTRLARKEHKANVEDLLVSIGTERPQASHVVANLKSMRLISTRTPDYEEPNVGVHVLSPADAVLPRVFASCCEPAAGDEIVGYRRNDDVLVIHKRSCTQLEDRDRLIQVKWGAIPYVLVVEAFNRPSLASDISTLVTRSGIDMQAFSAFKRDDGIMAEAHIYPGKTTIAQRDRLVKALEGIQSVTNVEVIQSSFFSPPPYAPKPSAAFTSYHRPNPYGSGIAEGSRFYGRDLERERILSLLDHQGANTAILIWGQRRIGKTSFVLRLKEQAAGKFLSVYLDLQGLKDASTTQFLYRIMTSLAQALNQVLKEHKVNTHQEITVPALNRLRKAPLAQFDTFMDLAQEITRFYPLVIMLDEFECLHSLREEEVSRSAIFNRLRSHSQHGQGIRLVLSGGGLMGHLSEQSDITSLFNVAHAEKLGCLEQEAAHRLIKDGLSKVGSITEPAITLIQNYTSNHPYYLQLLCSLLYDYAQENKSVITSDVASQRIREWLKNADASRFQHLWEGRSASSAARNKLILSALAQLGDTLHVVEYSRLLNTIGVAVAENDLVQSLNELSELGVLEHDHTNHFIKVDLFARWLRQHYPLDMALKEVH